METQDEQLINIWDERWKGSDRKERLTFLGRQMFKAKKKILREVIKDLKVKTVIEVGCGLGHTMRVFHDAKLDYIGIDASANAVKVCRAKDMNAELKRLEDVNEQYDLVSSDGMLEHFLNFEPYAKHLMRISRLYVLLIQPNHGSFLGKTLAYISELLRTSENVFEYNYRMMDFIRLFQENGFIVEKDLPVFFNAFRLILFRRI